MEALAPGMVAVMEIPAERLPADARLTGLSQEAGFYLYGTASAVALIAIPLDERPGIKPLRLHWEGGLKRQAFSLRVRKAPYPRQSLKVPRLHSRLKAARGGAEHELIEEAAGRSEGPPLWRGAFVAPVPGELTAPFGAAREYNRGAAAWRHKGEDLRAPEGTPVLASNHGVVALARSGLVLSGGTMVLAHGYGLCSAYYHLSRLSVAEGEAVQKGQLIGYSGATGLATGPHLHFQMELRGIPVHPRQWIAPVDPRKTRPSPALD